MSDLSLEKGEIFADRFRIEKILGIGGYAHVYLATHLALERPVALKIMNPVANSTVAIPADKLERFFKRFEREAQIVSKLRVPETVEVYEYGRTDDGFAYMALEYIEGRDLLQVMNAEAPLAPERVARIISGILRSLREAHELGVHHRDIKPANVMIFERLGDPDCVKMLDFGVVKITRDIGVSYSRLTSEGNVVGTPRYMAPEYIRDNTVNAQTDLYAVGLVAWEMLVGRPAIQGDNAMEVMTAHVAPEPLKVPESIDLSPRLRAVVDGLLEKDPRRRFESADDVLELLQTGKLAGFTQDEMTLAATLESHDVRDVAEAFAPATESWERAPATPLDEGTTRGGEPPAEPDQEPPAEHPNAPDDATGPARESVEETRRPVGLSSDEPEDRPRRRHDPRRRVDSLGDGPIELDWPLDDAADATDATDATDVTDGSTAPAGPSRVTIAVAVVTGLVVGIAIWIYLRG